MNLFPILQFRWQNLNSPSHLHTSNISPLYPAASASSNGALWFWKGDLSWFALWTVAYSNSSTFILQLLSSPLHLTLLFGTHNPQAIGHFFLNTHLLQNFSGLLAACEQALAFSLPHLYKRLRYQGFHRDRMNTDNYLERLLCNCRDEGLSSLFVYSFSPKLPIVQVGTAQLFYLRILELVPYWRRVWQEGIIWSMAAVVSLLDCDTAIMLRILSPIDWLFILISLLIVLYWVDQLLILVQKKFKYLR